MPPPTRAKRAWVDAPIPKVSMVVVMMTSFWAMLASFTKILRRMNQRAMSKRPRPTTVSPMTAPERKATLRPEFRLRRAALAVRPEAYVAVRMPMKPARPEKKPPVRNANGTHGFCTPKPYARMAKKMASTMNTMITTLYCCLRYAIAPSRTYWAIFFIVGVPSSSFFIW